LSDVLGKVPGAAALIVVPAQQQLRGLTPEDADNGDLYCELQDATIHDKRFEERLVQFNSSLDIKLVTWIFKGVQLMVASPSATVVGRS
jgi:hypothetical protein